jgi:hypothetical protein
LRIIDGKKFIYAVNLSLEKEYTVTFDGEFNGFTALDLESGKTKNISSTVHFGKGQSFVLFYSQEQREYVAPQNATLLTPPFKVKNHSGNYYTLDCVRFSTDGVNYSESKFVLGVFDYLLKQRYNGDLWLKYEFNVKTVPEKIWLLAEDMNTVSCTVNGKSVVFDGCSDFEKAVYKADVASAVTTGINQIVFKINYYQKDGVYYALFGENVTEGLRNCLTYDTAIEAVYLTGDFGVFIEDGFKKGKEKNVWLGDGFYIDRALDLVTDTVTDGYPFFAGNMTLEKKFNAKSCDKTILKLNGRYATCKLKINGVQVEKSYFSDTVDITPYLKDGENTAEITLYSGNRNLLGPHHIKRREEEVLVTFWSWEMDGTWEGLESPEYRQEYSFVKFGLFND